jgi:hypothetical protein
MGNQKGIAMFEAVVLMIVFAVIVTYSIGFFGAIHTGIKNSIASRNLAFETFRNRSNLSYRRDVVSGAASAGPQDHYKNVGFRYHQTTQEFTPSSGGGRSATTPMWATDRKIAFVRAQEDNRSGQINSNIPPQIETQEADPIYIKTLYGICLNEKCGD